MTAWLFGIFVYLCGYGNEWGVFSWKRITLIIHNFIHELN